MSNATNTSPSPDKNRLKYREMLQHSLHALGPLDGRYAEVGKQLSPYFSEYALIRYRVDVEVQWLLHLLELANSKDAHVAEMASESSRIDTASGPSRIDTTTGPGHTDAPPESGRASMPSELNRIDIPFDLGHVHLDKIKAIAATFSISDAVRVKEIEESTRHDVKAVELFVSECLAGLGMAPLRSLVHLGCTSEDINNLAYARMVADAMDKVWLPAARGLIVNLLVLTDVYAGTPMLAHTHGQPASPTTAGKEFGVFAARLTSTLRRIQAIRPRGKFNGATGNYSAISFIYPKISWQRLSHRFVTKLGLDFNAYTTQIESHDWLCQLLDALRHFNNILRSLDQNLWTYISMEYLTQTPVAGEVGSSTMPHKINPIRFENSEANTEFSNAICVALSNELANSRLQRDLSDSSLLRNLGLAFGYSLQAIKECSAGLDKISVNEPKLQNDLAAHWEVLAEPIQTMLRKYGSADAYDQLKSLTRGQTITRSDLHDFISGLDTLPSEEKKRLLNLTPESYVGEAPKLAHRIIDFCGTFKRSELPKS